MIGVSLWTTAGLYIMLARHNRIKNALNTHPINKDSGACNNANLPLKIGQEFAWYSTMNIAIVVRLQLNQIHKPITARSAQRAQTAAPSLTGVKQSSQPFLVRDILKIPRPPPPPPVMLLTTIDTENSKENYFQWIKRNILKMFLITPCAISDLYWKFHENSFIIFSRNAAIRQNVSHLVGWPRKSLVRGETVSFIVLLCLSDIL